MGQETTQREPHLDDVHPCLARPRHRGAQDVDGKRDDHALMTRQLSHRSTEVARLDAHHVFGIDPRRVRRPVAVARA